MSDRLFLIFGTDEAEGGDHHEGHDGHEYEVQTPAVLLDVVEGGRQSGA